MQEDNTYEDLPSMLEALESRDIVPSWHKEAAWFRISEQLKQDRRRRLPLWIYPLAAAVLAICILLLVPPVNDRHRTLSRIPAPQSVPHVPIQKLAVLPAPTNGKQTLISAPTKELRSTKTLAPAADTTALVVLPSPVIPSLNAPAAISPHIVKREPEVIYTISEIMADIPEQEAPPKRYSGFFNSSRGQMLPPDNTLRRSRESSPIPEIPVLITN